MLRTRYSGNDGFLAFQTMGPGEKTIVTGDDVQTDSDIRGGTVDDRVVEAPAARIACERLTRLDLSHSQLKELPKLDGLENLARLNVSHNKLTDLPPSLRSAKCLRVLDASHNQIASFPQILVDSLVVLRTIDLSHNELRHIPPLACVQHLTELLARNCNISVFPPWILFERHNLEILDLSVNPVFANFAHDRRSIFSPSCALLKKADFSNTSLTRRGMTALKKFSNLEILDIGSRHYKYQNTVDIKNVSDDLPSSLKVLHCVKSGLSASPSLESSHLEEVDLSNNRLFWIDPDFVSAALKVINLSACSISLLPDNIGDCSNLETLVLSNNDIPLLPPSFASLVNLKYLDLYKNSLPSFPQELLQLSKIGFLDLCQNQFEPHEQPWGPNSPSYADLRDRLRSKLDAVRSSGPAPRAEEPDDDQYEHHFSIYGSDDESESTDPAIVLQNSQKATAIEDEDWSSAEPINKQELEDNDVYRDRDEVGTGPQIYDDANRFYGQFLHIVPASIRQSPLFYHRIELTQHLKEPHTDVPMDGIVPGQFDDE